MKSTSKVKKNISESFRFFKGNNNTSLADTENSNAESNTVKTSKQTKSNKTPKKEKPLPPPTYVIHHYKSTIGIFSKIYGRKDFKWRVGIAIVVGLMMSFTSLVFIQNTGVYISGTSGIFQGIARVAKTAIAKEGDAALAETMYQILFYVLYLLTNIPLIVFSYKKMGKKFTILSAIVVIISNVVPLLINLIPEVKGVFVFGDTTHDTNKDLYLLDFQGNNLVKAPSMFLYALFAGLVNGVAYAMIIAVGGSTGGLDFISFFFAYKKKKPMGAILLSFNAASVFLSSFIGSFLAGGIADPINWNFYNFLSQNFVASVIYTIIVTIVINNLFPKDKIVKIQIYAEDIMAIRNYLYSVNFNHSLTINTTTGGYSLQEKKNIEIICLFIEVPKIIKRLQELDQQMMITVAPIKGIDGKLSVEESLN
ncbi:YitT family protein [Malacoplasma penetrans]|uniref:YitT family protein n=1 Tax=Malacoplasma penetrans TaxID=28227 RepID=UPI0010105406|nr:YitT family protein [Malacoplasma penetrans]RXY97092.1 YitT family protein [Malacoplasma penetrans]